VRAPRHDDDPDDGLNAEDYRHELTDALIDGVPSLTAAQIVQIRQRLVTIALDHGWVAH